MMDWHHEAAERGPTYVIREMAPHYTGNGEIVAKGIATTEYARLIAAAPDLLEALQMLVNESGTSKAYDQAMVMARAAIACATTPAGDRHTGNDVPRSSRRA